MDHTRAMDHAWTTVAGSRSRDRTHVGLHAYLGHVHHGTVGQVECLDGLASLLSYGLVGLLPCIILLGLSLDPVPG